MKLLNVVLLLFFAIISISTVHATTEGLVGHVQFGQGVEDGQTTNLGAVIHGAVFSHDRAGDANQSVMFDGIDDWVELKGLDCRANFDTDWSINIWVYLDSSARATNFIAGADGDAGTKQFVIGSKFVKMTPEADSASDWRVNFKESSRDKWHMYTVVWSKSGKLKVYIDGVFQGDDSDGKLADFCPENKPIVGAVNYQVKTQFFKGKIDDMRLYNRTLSVQEIRSLYGITP